MKKSKINKESQSVETAHDKGVNSTDLLSVFVKKAIKDIQQGINCSRKRYEKDKNFPYAITTCDFSINLDKDGNICSKDNYSVAVVNSKINYLF